MDQYELELSTTQGKERALRKRQFIKNLLKENAAASIANEVNVAENPVDEDDDHEILQLEDRLAGEGSIMQYGNFLNEGHYQTGMVFQTETNEKGKETGMLRLLNEIYAGTELLDAQPANKRQRLEDEMSDKFVDPPVQELREVIALTQVQ